LQRWAKHQATLADSGRRSDGASLQARTGTASELLAWTEAPWKLRKARQQKRKMAMPQMNVSANVERAACATAAPGGS